MKKIVALALALALALSLCTVAFGASAYSDFKNKGDNGWDAVSLTNVAVSYTSATVVKVDDEVTEGILGYYTFTNGAFLDGLVYVECAKADAESQVKVDGKVVYLDYVGRLTEGAVAKISYSAVGTKATVGDKCGNYDEDAAKYQKSATKNYKVFEVVENDETLVYINNGKGSRNILVGDVVYVDCQLDTAPVTVAHKWATVEGKLVYDWDKYDLDTVNGTVICKECGIKATVTNDFDKVPDNAEWEKYGDVYMFWVESSAAGTGTGVDSSKTFDAGVAMYVGLSLASVAGSAVVIGKKKEF